MSVPTLPSVVNNTLGPNGNESKVIDSWPKPVRTTVPVSRPTIRWEEQVEAVEAVWPVLLPEPATSSKVLVVCPFWSCPNVPKVVPETARAVKLLQPTLI